MAKKAYVFSTLSTDMLYVDWKATPNDLKVRDKEVLIKGGTGVANERIITPLGVATEIDGENLAWLEKNPLFKQHKEAGFIVVQDKPADPEKVASDMKIGDGSSPLNDQSPELKPDPVPADE